MACQKRKLNTLSIEDKVAVIRAVEKGSKKKSEIAKEFNIPTSTLSTYLKNKDSILKRFDDNKSHNKRKRIRECEYPLVDQAVLKWFVQCKDRNIPVDGTVLREQAEVFGKKLNETNFKASSGWLEKFKKRHGIVFNKICGESAQVREEDCVDWLQKLPEIVHHYSSDDVFNVDETGLFFKCTPDKTMTFKGDPCHGGKRSKERVTLLLGANMSGTEKLPPLMIGKSLRPRCFKNVKTLPLQYEANKKVWMTSDVFYSWLKTLDAKMARKKRKIILFIDNCTAHNAVPDDLETVKVQFLPPNTTSKLQPMDQGIIQNFKLRYRKLVVRKLLHDIDDGKTKLDINLLEAMRMCHKAWDEISETTIANCFQKAGFGQHNLETESPAEPEFVSDDDWTTVVKAMGNDAAMVSFEEFANIDGAVDVCGILNDSEIISEIASVEQSGKGSDDEDEDIDT